MNQNPYRSPEPSCATTAKCVRLSHWAVFGLIAPLVVTFTLYLPFRLLASQANTLTYAHSDDFYYVVAAGTWPSYAALCALLLSALSRWFGIGWGYQTVMSLIGIVAMVETWRIDKWLGWHDEGRFGLTAFPSNFDTLSTPELSVYLVIPVYILGWLCVPVAYWFSKGHVLDRSSPI